MGLVTPKLDAPLSSPPQKNASAGIDIWKGWRRSAAMSIDEERCRRALWLTADLVVG
jgi:hypothetical protein